MGNAKAESLRLNPRAKEDFLGIPTDTLGECVQTYSGHATEVWSIAFSPRDRLLVTGCLDCTAKVWDREFGWDWGEGSIGRNVG